MRGRIRPCISHASFGNADGLQFGRARQIITVGQVNHVNRKRKKKTTPCLDDREARIMYEGDLEKKSG